MRYAAGGHNIVIIIIVYLYYSTWECIKKIDKYRNGIRDA